MVDPQDIQAKSRVLTRLLGRKFGVSGNDLRSRRRRVGRLVPRKVRRALVEVERAEALVGHPRVALQLDPRRVEEAYTVAVTHLHQVDPNDRIKGYVLNVLAVNAFNVLVVSGLVIGWALYRGWV